EPALFQPHQARIERSHVQLNSPARYLFDTRTDGVAMHRSESGERLEHHQVKGALQHAGPLFIRHPNKGCHCLVRMSNGNTHRKTVRGQKPKTMAPLEMHLAEAAIAPKAC